MRQQQQQQQQQRHTSPAEEMGLGPKKTILILCTVVGCIAILFPKIFYPMLFSASLDPSRGPPNLYKQERPPHMKDVVHPGMQERGRAIPPHPSVPIVERPGRPMMPPGNVERRPGGVPGHPGASLRAAAYQAQNQQQQQQKGGHSMIMPLYTFCIVAFFVFTIVKILLKKTKKSSVEQQPLQPDPNFAEKVFKQDAKKKLVYTAIQGIIDATNEQLSEIEKECAEKNKEHNADKTTVEEILSRAEIKLDGKEKSADDDGDEVEKRADSCDELLTLDSTNSGDESKNEQSSDVKSEHDLEIEKRLNHLKEAMHIKSVENDENSDLKSIYLEGELPHDPKIFVSATETETKTEKLSQYPSAKDVVDEDETVILSGKMTISLISLANNDEEKNCVNGVVEEHTTTNNVA